jgi:hypothetical protein
MLTTAQFEQQTGRTIPDPRAPRQWMPRKVMPPVTPTEVLPADIDPDLPQEGDRVWYRTGTGPEIKGRISTIYANGRICFVPDDPNGRVLSLPRRFQNHIPGRQYGLVLIRRV